MIVKNAKREPKMSNDVHIIPINDYREHVESMDCWCRPSHDDGVVIHNAMDGRERFETGERKPS